MFSLAQHSALPPRTRRGVSAAGWRDLIGGLRRLMDLWGAAASGLAAAAATFGDDSWSGTALTVLVIGCLVATQSFNALGIYRSDRVARPAMDLPRVLLGWIITFLCLVAFLFALKASHEISRLWLLLWFLFGTVGLLATRVATAYVVARGPVAAMLVRQVAIVGTGEDAARLATIMGAGEPGFRLAAVYALDGQVPSLLPPGAHRLTGLTELEDAIRASAIDKVVLAVPPSSGEVLGNLLPALRCLPIEVGWAPDLPDFRAPILGLTDLGGVPVFRLSERPLDGWRAIVKGIEDRVLAGILLALAAPAYVLIAAAIKLDSPGPVFYRQQRRGFSREPIAVLKFRSMYSELCDRPDADVVRQATRGDPRVTRIGRILRRTSLDELPQLFNVLRGEMSLVGPRPHAVAHDQHYGKLIDNYLGRHRVKPGITGWAQVHGYRGETSNLEQMRRRVELDLYYIDHWSIWLDAQILFRTLIVGFVHRQAY